MMIRVATCKELPEVDGDSAPLAAAFAAAGVHAPLLAWDDPAVDWDEPAPTVLRSTWNYALHHEAFTAWLDRIAAAGPLWNPLAIVRGNLHKRYLLELAARGVPVVPTTLIERGEHGGELPELARFVIKPEIGAGSLNARVFRAGDPEAHAHLARLTRTGAALVQPYIESVEDHGERSMVWIDGALSHAIRKSPRFSGDSEQVTGPFPISDAERAVAEAALAPVAAQLLYARVDLARDASGQPMVMEMELVEPSLFFARGPGSADRFVRGLLRRLGH
jgi:glutathione synthase/RimK-type ligase-like ATP-grasp enzyme